MYVFRKSGTAWVEQTRIEDPVSNDEFARALALSDDGNTLIVSSRDYSTDVHRLRTYEYSASTWTEVAELDGSYAFRGTYALSPDGTVMIASTNDATAIDVFARSGSAWVKRARLPVPLQSVYFETSMACSARCERIAIGDFEPSGAGVAYVFDGDGTTLALTATLHAERGDVGDQFGRSIAISRDGVTVVVGASGENGAYLFRHHNDTWLQLLSFTGSNSGPNDIFGSRVAVSDDATTIAISAIYENSGSPGVKGDQSDESQPYAGAAYVFEGTY